MARRSFRTLPVSVALLLTTMANAGAADLCDAVALYDVPAIEDPKSILKRHEFDSAVTQWRVSKKDGSSSICSHGGYCYPTSVRIDGKLVDALILANCRVGRLMPDMDDDEFKYYDVEVIRSRVAPKELAQDDAASKLLEGGLCTACASNAAHAYVYAPRSRCADMVGEALAGSKAALARLNDDQALCDR